MNKRAVIFDMDGTLFKTDKVLISSLEKTFECLRSLNEWKGETPIGPYLKIMGRPLPEVWKNLLPIHEKPIHEKVNRIFHIHLLREIRSGKGELYPGVLSILKKLTEDYQIFIASNRWNSYLLEIINHFKLEPYLSAVYSIEECSTGKQEDLVAMILKENNLLSAVMVGDKSTDIRAGKENGLFAIGCSWGFACEGELTEADGMIDTFAELEDLLENQRRGI